MKTTIPGILLALLCASASAQQLETRSGQVWINCGPDTRISCPPPPTPPQPPAPPAPPAPPVAPEPPPMPEVPEQAHAACADKSAGTRVTWSLGDDGTMTGTCERKAGRMQFVLESLVKSR